MGLNVEDTSASSGGPSNAPQKPGHNILMQMLTNMANLGIIRGISKLYEDPDPGYDIATMDSLGNPLP